MNAREMIARLAQIDPETEIVKVESDFDYGTRLFWEIKSVRADGTLQYGKIIRSEDMHED